jgi:hypothetical protein
MPRHCEWIKTEHGVVHVQRSGGQRCAYCSREHTKLCDGPAPADANRKTCDRPLCNLHAFHAGPDTDYCEAHKPGAAR